MPSQRRPFWAMPVSLPVPGLVTPVNTVAPPDRSIRTVSRVVPPTSDPARSAALRGELEPDAHTEQTTRLGQSSEVRAARGSRRL